MNYRLLVLLVVFCAAPFLRAEGNSDYARVSFIGAGKGKPAPDRNAFVIVVVEGPYIAYEKNRVPDDGLVEYVNNLLKVKGVSYLAVYVREGVKYGDVMKAIDALRKTTAKDIGVSTVELANGREP